MKNTKQEKKTFLFMKTTDTNILKVNTLLSKHQRLNDLIIDSEGPVKYQSPTDLKSDQFFNHTEGSDKFFIKTFEKVFTRERTNFILYR